MRWEWVNFPDQARLPHPGLADHGDDLAVPAAARASAWRSCSSSPVAPDEAGQPTRGAAWSRERAGPAPVSS